MRALPFLTIANLRSLDQLLVQRDRGVENPGHRTALLGITGEASKCRVVQIPNLAAPGLAGEIAGPRPPGAMPNRPRFANHVTALFKLDWSSPVAELTDREAEPILDIATAME